VTLTLTCGIVSATDLTRGQQKFVKKINNYFKKL